MDSLRVFYEGDRGWVATYAGVDDVTGIGDTEADAIKSLARGLGGRLLDARERVSGETAQ